MRVIDLLRMAKLISAKLGLLDVEAWISSELDGYGGREVPDYRTVRGRLEVMNPAMGWVPVSGGNLPPIPIGDRLSEVEEWATRPTVHLSLDEHVEVNSAFGNMADSFIQRAAISGSAVRGVIEAVRDKLLDWSVELEKRGITGENMSFGKEEQAAAHSQIFHIQNLTGIAGNVTNSSVAIYDYSAVHQTLRSADVPQKERNALEDIMDELKGATPAKKPALLEKAKTWLVKNQEFLGASAALVRRMLGLE